MASINITISVPETSLSIFRATPQVFAQEMRLAAAVKWYELGKISQAKAAELAGVSRAGFLHALGVYNVSPYQVTADELMAETAGNA